MRVAAFIRYSGANGLGHVGWSFDFDASQVNAGSVENPLGTPTCDPTDMGYWDVFCSDPIPEMAEKRYDALKYVDQTQADPSGAYRVAQWIKSLPYCVFGRNCLDDTYDVLRAYGVVGLPPPSNEWLPREWFEKLNATQASLVGFKWSNRPAASVLSLATLPLKDEVFSQLFPLMPSWRDPGSNDWHDLQTQLAEVSRSPYVQQHVAS